jgi:hypothetical protein
MIDVDVQEKQTTRQEKEDPVHARTSGYGAYGTHNGNTMVHKPLEIKNVILGINCYQR